MDTNLAAASSHVSFFFTVPIFLCNADAYSTMDDGSRISPQVESFLRKARAGDVADCRAQLTADPSLVNAVEAGGYSALHFAAFQGNLPMIELLKEFNTDWNVKNFDGNTPLMLAAKMAKNDAVSLLASSGADLNFASDKGTTAAHHAVGMGHLHTLRHLKSLGATTNFPRPLETGGLIHWASHHGEVDTVATLIYEFGVSIDDVDAHGGTALFNAVFTKKPELVLFLLEHGANPNIACGGCTPLILSVTHGTLDEVKALVAFGADATAEDVDGKTAVEHAKETNRADSARELTKEKVTGPKRLQEATRFKDHGNKVFGQGENNKAAKFYTLAISLDPTNHVFFSNRSACHYNTRQYLAGLWDAERCVALSPKWPKGYMRKAATLKMLNRVDDAKAACAAGLALDPANVDLRNLKTELDA